jgi:7-cyano-7-deazaguanine synthase in queuosine biosynthesis
MKKECLLYTAGIDSFIAREYLISKGHNIDCLYFNHGGRYTHHELQMIEKSNCDTIVNHTLNFSELETDSAYIPNRNLLMTVMAQSLGYSKIWLGGSLSDNIGDNKSEVYSKLSKILSDVNDTYIKINSPFYHVYKSDMVKWFINEFPTRSDELVSNTFSCFNPIINMRNVYVIKQPLNTDLVYRHSNNFNYNTHECGKCNACFRKAVVLYSGGLFIEFNNTEIVDHYRNTYSNSIDDNPRSKATMSYINRWERDHAS